jgi:hypothetical protein
MGTQAVTAVRVVGQVALVVPGGPEPLTKDLAEPARPAVLAVRAVALEVPALLAELAARAYPHRLPELLLRVPVVVAVALEVAVVQVVEVPAARVRLTLVAQV